MYTHKNTPTVLGRYSIQKLCRGASNLLLILPYKRLGRADPCTDLLWQWINSLSYGIFQNLSYNILSWVDNKLSFEQPIFWEKSTQKSSGWILHNDSPWYFPKFIITYFSWVANILSFGQPIFWGRSTQKSSGWILHNDSPLRYHNLNEIQKEIFANDFPTYVDNHMYKWSLWFYVNIRIHTFSRIKINS